MPELPEVETVMRGLAARLTGRVLARVAVHRADLRWPLPQGLERRLTGARVLGFRRRGKYILMRLDGGDSLLLHLGMSGRIVIGRAGANASILHEHLVLETDDGGRVGLVDPRRFGSVDLVATAAEDGHRLLAGLGPEPLEAAFTPAVLARCADGQADADQGGAAGSARGRGAGQYLCVRGVVPGGDQPAAGGRDGCGGAGGAAGGCDQGDVDGGDRGGRVELARLRAAERGAGVFPACVEGVRAGGGGLRAVSGGALCGDQADRAGGEEHVLLREGAEVGWWKRRAG